MEAITLRELLEAVGGTLIGPAAGLEQTVSHVDTDSRNIHPGSLFIPLVGSALTATPTSTPPWRGERRAASPSGSGRAIGRTAFILR